MTKGISAKIVIGSGMISVTDLGHQVQFIALESQDVLDSFGVDQGQLVRGLAGRHPPTDRPLRLEPTGEAQADRPIDVRLVAGDQVLVQQTVVDWSAIPPPPGAFSHRAPAGFDVRTMEDLGQLALTQALLALSEPAAKPTKPTSDKQGQAP